MRLVLLIFLLSSCSTIATHPNHGESPYYTWAHESMNKKNPAFYNDVESCSAKYRGSAKASKRSIFMEKCLESAGWEITTNFGLQYFRASGLTIK